MVASSMCPIRAIIQPPFSGHQAYIQSVGERSVGAILLRSGLFKYRHLLMKQLLQDRPQFGLRVGCSSFPSPADMTVGTNENGPLSIDLTARFPMPLHIQSVTIWPNGEHAQRNTDFRRYILGGGSPGTSIRGCQ